MWPAASCCCCSAFPMTFPSNCKLKRFLPSVAMATVAAMRKASGACMEPTALHSRVSELRAVYDDCEAERMPHTRVQSSHYCLPNRHEAEHRGKWADNWVSNSLTSSPHLTIPPHNGTRTGDSRSWHALLPARLLPQVCPHVWLLHWPLWPRGLS